MKRMRALAGIALVALFAASCGGGDDDTPMCPGSPSGGCEEVVGSEDECPSWEQVCDGICGFAEYECCYCGRAGGTGEWEWQTSYITCGPCIDAGPDSAP